MRKVVIARIGSTPFGRHPDMSVVALAVRAADAAIKQAGLPRSEIGAVYLGNFVSGPLVGQEVLAGLVGEGLSLGQVPCTKVEGACASGGIAFRHACLAVATGLCDAALAIGVEKMSHADTPTVTAALPFGTISKRVLPSFSRRLAAEFTCSNRICDDPSRCSVGEEN